MARNEQQDRLEANRRKEQLIKAGFELFSEKGIESVSLSAVASKANVGVSTMYKYFQNKVTLVAAISGYIWGAVWENTVEQYGAEQLEQMDPYQLIGMYSDIIISLYRDRPEVLRFSGNYKTFVCRENASAAQLHEHLDPLKPISELYHKSYDAAVASGAIRTDMGEERLFSYTALTILAMAERYAQGIVWTETPKADHLQDLENLKIILTTWMKG